MKSVYFCVYLSKKSYPVVVAATGFSLSCVDRKDTAVKALCRNGFCGYTPF